MIRVAEEFVSLQGEGQHIGRPMYFVRLAGCSVISCLMHPKQLGTCDSDWQSGRMHGVEDVAARCFDSGVPWVCITGGEPTDQPEALAELICRVRRAQRVSVQTAGRRAIAAPVDSLCVSPKGLKGRAIQGQITHEIKVTAAPGVDVEYLKAIRSGYPASSYYVVPYDDGGEILEGAAVDLVLAAGDPWRLSLQSQKYAKIR